jgi:proline racemase
MSQALSLFTVETHTAGQPTRIVVGGLPRLLGDTVAAKRDVVRTQHDGLRTFLTSEPRGHTGMYGAYLVEPSHPDASAGVIFFSTVNYDDMCGHGIIGVATALVAEGMVATAAPETQFAVETPAGLVPVRARIAGGKAASVILRSVPAFVLDLDVSVDVPEVGSVRGDVAFGGNWYFYVDATSLGIPLDASHLGQLRSLGAAIKAALTGLFDLRHPLNSDIAASFLGVSFVQRGPDERTQRNLVVEGPDFFDRSPCGTGTCGRLATLVARGELATGDTLRNDGLFGGHFLGTAVDTATVGDYSAIIPEIEGSASITGYARFILEPDDPFGMAGLTTGS